MTTTYRRDTKAENEPSHSMGLGPHKLLVAEPGAKALFLVLKAKEVNKLFRRHWFYVVSSFSRSNTARQPFTVGRPLSGAGACHWGMQ